MSDDIYYGAGFNVIGPYHEDEFNARRYARQIMGQSGRQVYHIVASSYQEARAKLLRARRS